MSVLIVAGCPGAARRRSAGGSRKPATPGSSTPTTSTRRRTSPRCTRGSPSPTWTGSPGWMRSGPRSWKPSGRGNPWWSPRAAWSGPRRHLVADSTPAEVRIAFLSVSYETAFERAHTRHHAFFPEALVSSQFAALELPGDDEPNVHVFQGEQEPGILIVSIARFFRSPV